ncbi:hypothetical protein TrCOL_g9127 [Triparma columacea]|uniref:DNA mismatch repair proteins mutS family domain-containing protein n=1 Tax=Triparma columacea TaxID=722753 RepID=A0A9W7GD15_9STRA|nr:hypothetical protein TrCOL_g9127 [Triparma columacea]
MLKMVSSISDFCEYLTTSHTLLPDVRSEYIDSSSESTISSLSTTIISRVTSTLIPSTPGSPLPPSLRYNLNPKLYPALNKLHNTARQMNSKMDQIASRYSTSSYNSSELFKVLGTYVLEVKPGDAKKVGRTKGRSRTGKHVYVEPRDIGVVRDKLRDVEDEIDELEASITRSLFTSVMDARSSLINALSYIKALDLLIALSNIPGKLPDIVNEGVIEAEGYLHPLLKSEGVRVDLKLKGKEDRGGNIGLTISGSNGGGKTVALKSFGLLALSPRFGFPCDVSSNKLKVGWWDVHTCIGDGSGIGEGSTMEWRLRRYRDILNPIGGEGESFTKSKLVVIDELGTGTSQDEGYAVGRTVMEGLVNATDRTTGFVVTTHNDDLKVFSHSHPDISSASTRGTTRKLNYGVWGTSEGLEAVEREGGWGDGFVERVKDLLEEGRGRGGGGGGIDELEGVKRKFEEEVSRLEEVKERLDERERWIEAAGDKVTKAAGEWEKGLGKWERKLDNIVRRVGECSEEEKLVILGDTVRDLRVARKRIISVREGVGEGGVKALSPTGDMLGKGTMVIILGGTYEGEIGSVVEEEGGGGGVMVRLAMSEVLGEDMVEVVPRVMLGVWGEGRGGRERGGGVEERIRMIGSGGGSKIEGGKEEEKENWKKKKKKGFESARQRKAAKAREAAKANAKKK